MICTHYLIDGFIRQQIVYPVEWFTAASAVTVMSDLARAFYSDSCVRKDCITAFFGKAPTRGLLQTLPL